MTPDTDPAERELVEAVAQRLVARAAPEEGPLFAPTSRAYFEDPEGTLAGRAGSRDDMLGFGVDAAVVLVTPIALEVAKRVVSFVAAEVEAALKEEGGPRIRRAVARLLGVEPAAASAAAAAEPVPDVPALTAEQLRRVRELSREHAQRLGLPEPRAAVLADAVVGSLVA